MSDSVVKIRIDSKEYDANIKRAGQALTDYFNKVKEGGGTLTQLDEGVMEAVKAMGELGTQSKNTKGALRELTQATTDMTAAYRGLTDEEKNSPLGQAMQQSIQQMTERAGDMKDAMGDVQASIDNASSDTRTFDQIAGGAQLMTTGYQTLAGAAKLFGVETENNVEMLATLQAAMAVTSGLQTAQNLLQEESALMMGVQAVQASLATAAQTAFAAATGSATAAQRAFNIVANANPYVLLATAIIAVGSALYAFASSASKAEREAEELAKAEEKAAKKAEDARNSFVNTAAEAMNSASRLSALYVSYKNCNSEMEKTSILKQAQEEFKKLGIECNGVNDAQRLLVKDGAKVIEMIQLQGNAAAVAAIRMDAFKKSMSAILENRQAEKGFFDENDIKYAMSLAGAAVGDFDKMINGMQSRIQNLRGQLGIGKGKGGGGGRGHTGGTTTDDSKNKNKNKGKTKQKEKTEYELNEEAIKKLANEYAKLASSEDKLTSQDEERMAAIRAQISILQERNQAYKEFVDIAQGKDVKKFEDGEVGKLEEELSNMRKALSHASSTDEFKDIQEDIDILTIKIKQLKGEYETIFEKGSFSDILKATKDLEKLAKVENTIGADGNVVVTGRQNTGVNAAFDISKLSDANIKGFISAIKQQLDSEDMGGVVYDKLTERLKDATLMQSVLNGMIKGGVEGADFSDIANDIKKKLLEGDISDEDWQAFLDRINEKINSAGLKLKIEVDSDGTIKGITTQSEAMTKSWQKAAGAIRQVSGAISQLENPAAKIIGTIGQAIATVALAYADTLAKDRSSKSNIWAFIAAAAAATVSMATTIASIHSSTGYAEGGMIKGNSYSGDNIGGLVDGSQLVGLNAGEVVLSHAQTETLANTLENGQQGGTTSIPYVMGEQIFLGVNAFLKRSGRGELITTKG